MKKKILFGAIAAALVALNALAFSSFAAAPGGSGGSSAKCYQTMSYCSAWHLHLSCTTSKTGNYCSRYYCTSCPSTPVVIIIDQPVDRSLEIMP